MSLCAFRNPFLSECIDASASAANEDLTVLLLSGKLPRSMGKKNSAAVQLGRRGGKARGKKLSKQKRKEIARLGGLARWKKAAKK